MRSARRWEAAVVAGHTGTPRVSGIDETYTEYRSAAFFDRYDALQLLARSLAT